MQEERRMTDPYFAEVPWEIYFDDNGRQIGEYYKPLPLVEDRRKK